jgi:amino acid transporter
VTINNPKFTDSVTVRGTITNGTDGIAIPMSFIAVIWTMSGYDAPFHLSEECSNASIASPRTIVLTSGVGGILRLALQLVIAYTVTNIGAVLVSSQFNYQNPCKRSLVQRLCWRSPSSLNFCWRSCYRRTLFLQCNCCIRSLYNSFFFLLEIDSDQVLGISGDSVNPLDGLLSLLLSHVTSLFPCVSCVFFGNL